MPAELHLGLRYAPAELVPHTGAMCLLDTVEDYGQDWIETSVQIKADSRFSDEHGVPAWVGLEFMAQTIAAWSGIERVQAGLRPGIGLLIGTRRCAFEVDHFAHGWTLHLRAALLMRDEHDLAVFGCSIQHEGTLLAQAQVKAYRPQDVEAFLRGEATQ